MKAADRSVYLAFDYGTQSVGSAAGSQIGGVPSPLSAIPMFHSGPDWDAIDKLVREWCPAGFVVGQAYNASGAHTAASRQARSFGERVGARYRLPVHWVDETLSTESARRVLRDSGNRHKVRKPDLDNTAAALILETFLNAPA